jgi:mRNA interferase MazF
VLIVQDDLLTESALGTVMVAPLTSNLRRGLAIGNVELLAKHTGLSRPSVALVCQVATVDKSALVERVGRLPEGPMEEVDRGLLLALDLGMA